MSLATVYSRAQEGVYAPSVSVEVHLGNGLPSFSIVGLPEMAVKESKDRVRAALLTTNFKFPSKRIIVNLAPADLPKEGGRFDLPIALGILAASGQLPQEKLASFEFVGELSLSGTLRSIRGILPVALQAAEVNRSLVVPNDNADEASLVKDARVLPAGHLLEICAHIIGTEELIPYRRKKKVDHGNEGLDLADVRGQHRAKRALEIAAAGGHNMLMIGPPGTGKTMLASRIATILPPMTDGESLECAAITSISEQGFNPNNWGKRPFRAPHHTASGVALVGGGSNPRPGEISLAHHGVLFLDELTEFDRRVLEVLREPLESGQITIARAARHAEFPARFQLIAAMNPCPQGYDCDFGENCHCSIEQQRRFRARLSAPLLDRIDLHIDVPKVAKKTLLTPIQRDGDSSDLIRQRVIDARERQLARQGETNAVMNSRKVETTCRINSEGLSLVEQAMVRFRLSARAYHRILKVARTIADLDHCQEISPIHLSEAISYRSLERLL
ncbi:MAG: YifB family Mg chelatase-like AAA ATPase [Gammaproteobacteria bacterium]|nr:YifB family Mg chelatase-like AAA ATPase [Gammaproteobacteria bacterium]